MTKRMTAWIGALAAGLALAGLAQAQSTPQTASQEVAAWRSARQAQFAAFRAAHPDAAAQAAAAEAASGALAATAPAALAGPDAPSQVWPGSAQPVALWDAAEAPPMVVVPPGEFSLGPAPASARRRVRIPKAFAVSRYPVTVGEFADFVAETGHDSGPRCWTFEDEDGHIRQDRGWRNPGFKQADSHPVLCVSLTEVEAYIDWLSKKTGLRYRLLTEAEYEYVNRAGADTAYWWGDEVGVNHANCDGCGSLWDNRRTSPVGSFAANPFGLFDTTGDTWVWTSDCYVDPKAAPAPGAACEHVIKGGAWHGLAPRASGRFHHTPDTHSATLGIRLAREL